MFKNVILMLILAILANIARLALYEFLGIEVVYTKDIPFIDNVRPLIDFATVALALWAINKMWTPVFENFKKTV